MKPAGRLAPMTSQSVEGAGCTLSFDGRSVTIIRKGLYNTLTSMSGTTTVPLVAVSGIRFGKADVSKGTGFLVIELKDDLNREFRLRSYGRKDDHNAATFDPLGFIFRRQQQDEVQRVRDLILAALAGVSAPAVEASANAEVESEHKPSAWVSTGRRAAEPTQHTNSAGMAEQPKPDAALDTIEAIRKLGELRDRAILTEDEFQAKKRDLLDRL